METLKLTISEYEHLTGFIAMNIENNYSPELEAILQKLTEEK